jgi:hypothetical protein
MEGKAELIAYSHSPARKGQNQRRRIVAVVTQLIGQSSARFFAIAEHQASSSDDLTGCGKTLPLNSRDKPAEVGVKVER